VGPIRKESVWWKGRYLQRFSAEGSAVGYLLQFGKGTVEADFAGLDGDVARSEEANGWLSDQV
jgi:hypothetical protein